MFKAKWFGIWQGVVAVLLAIGLGGNANAGWTAYTSGDAGFNSPTVYANERTIDFSTSTPVTASANNSLTSEQTASRLSFSKTTASGASFTETDSTSATGMSGKHVKISSGTSGTASTLTVTFANGGTSYVAFDWYLGLKDQNAASVKFTFSDGTSQTLYSCNTTSTSTCLGAYVASNWLTNLFNALTLCLFGCNQQDTVYLTYLPSTGVKITSVVFSNNVCNGCGFLGFDASQDMYVDNMIYVDPTVAPHHLELTTGSATVTAGSNTTFTIKSCMDAACSTSYTTGMSGTLTLSGTGMTPTYPSGQSYAIGARSASGTLAASISPAGTATVALSAPSITPTGSPSVYCGMGVAAASGNSCALTVVGLHHLEVTTAATGATTTTATTYTIKACADAGCSTLFTGGVTGSLSVSGTGLVVTYSNVTGAFAIGSGSSSTSLQATITGAGTATVALASISPAASSATPVAHPSYYCGIGVTAASGNNCNFISSLLLDHLEVTLSSSTGLTCSPLVYAIKACADSACNSLFTAGVTGSLTVSGPSTVTYPGGQSFSIANGASTVNVSAWVKSTGTATVALSSVVPVGTNVAHPVYCGMGVGATSGGSCASTVASSALLFDVPNHVSEVSQSVSVSAVASNSDTTACTPAYASVSKVVTFKCSYSNPSSGTKAVRVSNMALNASNNAAAACDGTGQAVSLNFNSSGVATTTVQYADVGQVSLTATYTNASDPSLTGSDSFIAVPASFGFSAITSAPIKAGNTFSATVSAKNYAGAVTPNFGKETPVTADYVRLAWTKFAPAGLNGNEVFTGTGTIGTPSLGSSSFSNGAATVSDLKWTEVGVGDLSASLVGNTYLGVGSTTVTGATSSGGVGPFTPHHFTVTGLQGGCGTFSYAGLASAPSGQPFGVTVTALNAAGNTTANYGAVGSVTSTPTYPAGVALSAPSTSGVMSNALLTPFSAGVATVLSSSSTSPNFSFASKLTSPTVVTVRATDAVYSAVSSSGFTEGSVNMRSGRVKVSNAFGSQKTTLDIGVQTQFWNGKAWVINSDDSCSSIPVKSVALSNYLDAKGNATGAWSTTPATKATVGGTAMAVSFVGGSGVMTLSAPTNSGSGSVDFAFNLGPNLADQSCLALHQNIVSATDMSWLRSQNGTGNSCSGVTTYDRDPSARASFGVFSSETKKAVFVRDIY